MGFTIYFQNSKRQTKNGQCEKNTQCVLTKYNGIIQFPFLTKQQVPRYHKKNWDSPQEKLMAKSEENCLITGYWKQLWIEQNCRICMHINDPQRGQHTQKGNIPVNFLFYGPFSIHSTNSHKLP